MKFGPLLFVVGLWSVAQASAATLPVSEDTFSSRGQLTAATNKSSTLKVDSSHSAYLYFDLSQIPASTAAQIRYARLRLFLTKVSGAGGGIEVHTVTSPWDEALASAEPTQDATPVASIPPTEIASKRFTSVDVTTAVRAWMGGSANQGFAVLSAGGSNLIVAAKEGPATGYPAELDIELNADSGSITADQLSPNLTLAGTTSGTFAGNGTALSLSTSNLVGKITNGQLTHGGFTLSLGEGLSGDASVDLGNTLTLNNTGVLSLAGGGGVTVSAGSGHITLGSTATDANTAGAIVQRDQNGAFAASTVTASTFEGHGALPWEVISGTTQTASPNTGYIATNASQVILLLPVGSRIGDIVRLNGIGTGGWKIIPSPGQNILGYALGDGPSGSSRASATIQYTGLNQWQLVSESQIATGSITNSQLAADSIETPNIVSGAVTNAKLANSSLTVTAGSGLSGGGVVSLGGTVTLTNAGVTALSGGGGITVSGSAGNISLGSNATPLNTPSAIVTRDASGNFSAGTVNANLAGNASSATTAVNFTGPLSGDVIGSQSSTVVASIAGVNATNVASGAALANAATNTNIAGTIVRRDAGGSISIASVTSAGSVNLPATTASSVGVIIQNGSSLLHTFGPSNFFSGRSAGNFSMTGSGNTGLGGFALNANTSGFSNTAVGSNSLLSNDAGTNNTGVGTATLRLNTSGNSNTAVGSAALRANTTGSLNTGLGASALIVNTTGSSNTSVGGNTLLANTVGSYNTAIGESALASNTTAGQNVAVGYKSLSTQSFDNAGASWNSANVAVGYNALAANQPTNAGTGNNNTAIGWSALAGNTTGAGNNAFGYGALQSNTTAFSNCAFGYIALNQNTTGFRNTAIGNSSLKFNTTGSNNIALGLGAGDNLTTGSNNIDIGNEGVAAESNTIRIGTEGVHSKTLLVGNVGVGTDIPSANLEVNGSFAVSGAFRVPGAGVGTGGSAFIQVTTAGNVTTTIDHPLCNGDPNALLIVTHRAAGDINDVANRHNHVMGVTYFSGHWYIYNEDFAFMPAGVQFNVLIVKP